MLRACSFIITTSRQGNNFLSLRKMLFLLITAFLAACSPNDLPAPGEVANSYHATSAAQMYAGIDISGYPGYPDDLLIKSLKNSTNLQFTGFYLGDGDKQAPHHPNKGWMNKRQILSAMGWGMAPIYVGRQQDAAYTNSGTLIYASDLPILTASLGTMDGYNATVLMLQAGFPPGSVVYLDNESGNTPTAKYLEYYRAWNNAVFDNGFTPGIYCSHRVANSLRTADSRPVFWIFQINEYSCHAPDSFQFPTVDPAASGIPFAMVWQIQQNCPQKMDTSIYTIDYNVSSLPDPSRLIPTTPTGLSPINSRVVTGNSVTLQWSPLTAAANYKVAIFGWNGTEWANHGTLTGNVNHVSVDNLPMFTLPYTTFAWKVTACTVRDCSIPTDWQYFNYQR